MINKNYCFHKIPKVCGKMMYVRSPNDNWCRTHFPLQVLLEGKGIEDCYVRRFIAKDGNEYLFAVNVVDNDIRLSLLAEQKRIWLPFSVDGKIVVETDKTKWLLPARCCGLFKLEHMNKMGFIPSPRSLCRRTTGRDRVFRRLDHNILRLNQPMVKQPGKSPFVIDFPQPYWQLFKDFTATHIYNSYMGAFPLESTVPEKDLYYCFHFSVADSIKTPKLVIDPRCSRGVFQIFLNRNPITKMQSWPLEGITPQRLPLKKLRKGTNVLELCFVINTAQEGLLSQLYIEGDFYVDLSGKIPVIRELAHAPDIKGWQSAGLPHYMGRGSYRWNDWFSNKDLHHSWYIEFDGIIDSAELSVNAQNLGTRAWAPWRWNLANLKNGINDFELVVSSTAGNKHKYDWPNQPQGWIGEARLVAEKQIQSPSVTR